MSLAGGTASVGIAMGKRRLLDVAPAHRVTEARSHGHASVQMGKVPVRYAFELQSPVQDKMRGYVAENRKLMPLPFEMCRERQFAGQTLALCGAGPSLGQHYHELGNTDQIWAINSALPWLVAHDVAVTAGLAIDQTPRLVEEWASRPDVQYYLASTVDPALTRLLLGPLHNSTEPVGVRRIAWCHNYCGLDGELDLYKATWPKPAYVMAAGHTTVSRAIGLAQWMGFRRIDVYGADCCFSAGDVTHANGERADEAYHNPLVLRGVLDGREWRTRPDMLMGAVDLARRVRDGRGMLRLIGDTLPVALLGLSDSVLDRVCRTLEPGELPPEDN